MTVWQLTVLSFAAFGAYTLAAFIVVCVFLARSGREYDRVDRSDEYMTTYPTYKKVPVASLNAARRVKERA